VYTMLQYYAAATLNPMDKMWVSFIGMGLMVIAALIITYARLKTKGWIRIILSIAAIILLIYGIICGLLAIV
jgi:hypothetical protein